MMNSQRCFRLSIARVWLALAGGLAWLPAGAHAEGFFDFYAGAAFPESSRPRTSADAAVVAHMVRYNSEIDWKTSPSVGIRGGYWIETYPSIVGLGLDFSYYNAHEDSDFAPLKVDAVPITPLLMLRAPIGFSERYPGGRVQPYAAVGPGFTIAHARASLEDLRDTTSGLATRLDNFHDTRFDVGLDARAGMAFLLGRRFALFGEYRYTYLDTKFKDHVETIDNTGADFDTHITIKPKLSTHHLVAGISFRF